MTERLSPPPQFTQTYWGELRALTEDTTPHIPALAYALSRWADDNRDEALTYVSAKFSRRHPNLPDALEHSTTLAHQGRALTTGARLSTPEDVEDAFSQWASALAWRDIHIPNATTSLWLPAEHNALRLTHGYGRARVQLERPGLPPRQRGRPAWITIEERNRTLRWAGVNARWRGAFGDDADPHRFAHVDQALLEDRLEIALAWLMHMVDRKRAHRLLELVVLQSKLERLHVTLPASSRDPLRASLRDPSWLQERLRPASLTWSEDATLFHPECVAFGDGARRTMRSLQPEWLPTLRRLANERSETIASHRVGDSLLW